MYTGHGRSIPVLGSLFPNSGKSKKERKEDAVPTEDSPTHLNTNAKHKPQGVSLKCVIVFERIQKLQLLSCFQQQMYSVA